MKGLDLSKFKKVKVEKDSTTMKHEDGHTLKIAHKALSPQHKKALDAIPAYDDGGEVDAPESGVDSAQASMRKAFGYAEGGEAEPTPTPAPADNHVDTDKAAAFRKSFGGSQTHLPGYAKGGSVEDFRVESKSNPKTPHALNKKLVGAAQKQYYADGGDVTLSAQDVDPNAPLAIANPKSVAGEEIQQAYEAQHPTQEQSLQTLAQDTPPQDDASKMADASHKYLDAHAKLVDAHQKIGEGLAASAGQAQAPVPQTAPEQPGMVPSTTPDQAPQGDLVSQAQGNLATQNAAETAAAGQTQKAEEAKAGIFGQQAQDMQALHQKYQQIGDQLHQKYENLADQVAKGQIDPGHWFHSKTGSGQVMTVIGMLLGGLSAGVGGHPEQANAIVDKFIDQDIDAQKANLQNKNTLLGKYMEMYNSLPQAEAAARLTMSAGVEGLINQQAAKLGSANAMNAARMANATRRQALLPQLEGLAKGQAMMGMYQSMGKGPGGGSPEDAYKKQLSDLSVLAPERYKIEEAKYIPNVGVASQPLPEKMRDELVSRHDLSEKLARLESFAKAHAGTTMDRATVNEGKVLAGEAQNAYRTGTHQGVFKEGDQKFIESLIPSDPTAYFGNTRTLPRYRQLRDSNNSSIQLIHKSYGVKPFQSSAQGPETKTMGGVQYQKVPGGWQKVK